MAKEKNDNMVAIKLFKDGDKYKDAVRVTINGDLTVIERGVVTKVSRDVADILEQSENQDNGTALMMERMQEEFQAKSQANSK